LITHAKKEIPSPSFDALVIRCCELSEDGQYLDLQLPILLDVKGPLELQVRMSVIINECGDSIVVTTGNHA
jgi:hypothetical protein